MTSALQHSVELITVDEEVLAALVAVATADADPDDVTPPLGAGWTPQRIEWLQSFHRDRRAGLANGDEETAAIRVDGRVAGATRLHRSPETTGDLEYGVWLAKAARGKGLSALVLDLVAQRAAQAGASRLIANTTAGNEPALRTLRRAGAELHRDEGDGVRATIMLPQGTGQLRC